MITEIKGSDLSLEANMFGIWNDPDAKDEDIKQCYGDYIGCEVCIHKEKCLSFLKEKIEQALNEGGKNYDV